MRLLITASLLSSWEYYLNSQDEAEDQALTDFLSSLRREPIKDNAAMQGGRAFETRVRMVAEPWYKPTENEEADLRDTRDDGTDERYTACVAEVADMVRGGCWQVKASKPVEIAGQEFMLYGRLDVLRGPWIHDIKFSHTFEAGKYRDAPQTKMYLALIDGPEGIRYDVSDGNNVYVDEYRRRDVEPIENTVADFWSWINAQDEYLSIYLDKWRSYE
jgi:hypothetical protein